MSLVMRLFYLLIAITFALMGCQPNSNGTQTSHVLMHNDLLQIELSPEIARVETPLLLRISGNSIKAISGEIVGVSMYMGKVPLMFSHNNGNWQAEFLLGACSDPKMKWQIVLTVEFADGKKQTIKQELESSW